MFIKELYLNSFKSYASVKIEFDLNFNVIIGENNIGKTTLFEALQLWKKCFDICITSNGKNFYSPTTPLYINFQELYFLRLAKDDDIFYGEKRSCEFSITIAENDLSAEYNLGFKLTKPQIKNAYIRVALNNTENFNNFKVMLNNKSIKIRDFIFIHQTNPVANVLKKEPFMYIGQIKKKIEKGKSNEVLRNKILQSLSHGNNLIDWMKRVLEIDFEFKKHSSKEKDEYIKLDVCKNDCNLEIYLQGSGFLQTAEIFSTIDIMDNSLNILLIDEPDSHISPRIQSNLLNCLKDIENTQIFVISHNDNFVADLNSNNIIFINDENKKSGNINPLNDINIDSLHNNLGGVISGLTKLQKSKKVIFVEGKDDIEYIKKLNKTLTNIHSPYAINFNDISFWFIRGKDYIIQKVMTGKQLLEQAIPNCHFGAIFDKDYSTISANESLKHTVSQRLSNSTKVRTHKGYCIESVLFSDLNLLNVYLSKLISNESYNLDEFIANYFSNLSKTIASVSSPLYINMKNKFASQKKDSRPELNDVNFDSYANEASQNIEFVMNKDNISTFVLELERDLGTKIIERDNDESETISSRLLEEYFISIQCDDDIYDDYKALMEMLRF